MITNELGSATLHRIEERVFLFLHGCGDVDWKGMIETTPSGRRTEVMLFSAGIVDCVGMPKSLLDDFKGTVTVRLLAMCEVRPKICSRTQYYKP